MEDDKINIFAVKNIKNKQILDFISVPISWILRPFYKNLLGAYNISPLPQNTFKLFTN